MPPEAVDLVSQLLQYSPNLRCTAVCDWALNSTHSIKTLAEQVEQNPHLKTCWTIDHIKTKDLITFMK
jgi:hypothetical protein